MGAPAVMTPSETALSAEEFHDAWVTAGFRCDGTHAVGEALCQNVAAVVGRLDAARSQPATDEDGRDAVEQELWDLWTTGERAAYGVGYRRGRSAILAASEPDATGEREPLPNPSGLRCFPGCPHTADEPNCSRQR